MYLGQLILKVANIYLETIGGPHLNGEEVMVILLELLTKKVLSEKQLGEISEAVDSTLRKRVESVRGYPFQARGKDPAHDGVASGMVTILSWY